MEGGKKFVDGFGLIELLVAVGLWSIIAVGGVTMGLGSLRLNRLGSEATGASFLAAEGVDAVRSIKKQGWGSPFILTNCTAGCGVATSSGTWAFSGTSNVMDKYTRKVFITQSQRDGSGNIVDSGGTADPDTYKVVSQVSWSRGVPPVTNTFSVVDYLTNFTKSIMSALTGGLLVYGDGSTVAKARFFDDTTNVFSAESLTATASSGVTFVSRTSPTKNEAIAGYVTAGGVLQIMCFDGLSWSNEWTVTVGGTGTTKRFDIAYETNSGDAMVLYSTNTGTNNELGYRSKLGSSGCGGGNWSAATNVSAARTDGVVQWVKMAWDRRGGQNLIAALWADSASDLSVMIWSGTTWGNEPTAVTEASLEILAVAQDVEDFDIEYESISGDVMMVWANSAGTNGTNGVRYRTCTGGTALCTWSAVTTPPTFSDDATNMDISANPDTDQMVFASIGNAGRDLQIGYWSGSAWTNSANADTSCQTPTAGSKRVATGWVVNGADTRSIIRYADQGSSSLDWYSGNLGVFTKETDFSNTPAPSGPTYYSVEMNPISKDKLMALVSDASNRLVAKQLTMTAGAVMTWTNVDGTYLTTLLPQAINSPYSFAFWRQ